MSKQNLYFVHREYPFTMMPRVWYKLVDYDEQTKKVKPTPKTPSIPYSKLNLQRARKLISDEFEGCSQYYQIDSKKLFDEFIDEYKNNLKAYENVYKFIDIRCDNSGNISDFEISETVEVDVGQQLEQQIIGNEVPKIYMGGCFLGGCLHNAIRNIQNYLYVNKLQCEIVIVPQVTLVWEQPAEIFFQEQIDELNDTIFFPAVKPIEMTKEYDMLREWEIIKKNLAKVTVKE